jgi:hypothetical protein
MHIHTYIHTYTHPYIHTGSMREARGSRKSPTYIHTYMHTCIHAYIHTHIHTYIQEACEKHGDVEKVRPDKKKDNVFFVTFADKKGVSMQIHVLWIHLYLSTVLIQK